MPQAQLDPLKKPTDKFLRTVHEAIQEFNRIANSHAIDVTKKARMKTLIARLGATYKKLTEDTANLDAPRLKASINITIEDLVAMCPVPPREGMTPIKNKGDNILSAKPYSLLVKVGNTYQLRDPSNNLLTPVGTSFYTFVVLVACPTEVRLTVRANGGHTAISRGADVYFAGEIEFENGSLKSWNNDSGHYQTPTDLHQQIRLLLPVSHYKAKF